MKYLIKKIISEFLGYSKSLMFIGAFMLMNSLFAQNNGCENLLVFSYIPGTDLIEGTMNEYELKLPSNKWTPTGGVQTSSGRGNGTGALSFLRFEGDIKQLTKDGYKSGRVYSVRFTNTSKFTITFSLGWDGSPSGSYTLAPGETRRSYDASPWYIDGRSYPKFSVGSVQIKFSHAEKEKYGTYFSKYFDCNDTPDNVANNLLEEKEEKELKQDEAKIGSLPENSVENIESKISEYRSLANKYPGKAFQNEINELEQKKSRKGRENKAKEISRLSENTIEEIDKKIQQYEDLNNSGSETSYDGKIDALITKRNQLKGEEATITDSNNSKESSTTETQNNSGNSTYDNENGSNSNEGESDNEEEESDSEEGSYNSQNSLTTTYNQLVENANRMRANGQAGSPAYNRTMEEIRQIENRLGISGAESYYSRAKMKDAEDQMGRALGGIISGIADGGGYLGLTYNIRSQRNVEIEDLDFAEKYFSIMNIDTYELKMSPFGGGGFFMGLGFPNSEVLDEEGLIYVLGLEVDLYEPDLGTTVIFSINGEYGFGDIERTNSNDFIISQNTNFYSVGLSLSLFNFAYVGYNIGLYNVEEVNSETNEKLKGDGSYEKISLGFRFNF